MSKYVNLSELPTEIDIPEKGYAEGVPLAWDMNLPHRVDIEKIQINVRRLRTMHRVGAFCATRVASYEGEVTEIAHNIADMNADGSAIAGKSVVIKKAEKSKGNFEDIYKDPQIAHWNDTFGKPIAICRLNRSELASEAAEHVQEKNISVEEAWGLQLDIALRESMRLAGKQHLIGREETLSTIAGLMGGFTLAMNILESIQEGPKPLLIAGYGLMQAIPMVRQATIKRDSGIYMERRWSLLPMGLQPDRYLALNALTRIKGLARTQK